MGELAARKQAYKLSMFRKLHIILILAVLVIAGFFVATSLSFSSRYEEGAQNNSSGIANQLKFSGVVLDFAAGSWPYRWWLMDGYLSILYLVVFSAIASLWRPTGNNRRLAMSTELAQSEEDAEDYDLDTLDRRDHPKDLEEAREGQIRLGDRQALGDDEVVFEIGDEGSDKDADEDDRRHTGNDERRGLIGSGSSSPPDSARRVKDRMD